MKLTVRNIQAHLASATGRHRWPARSPRLWILTYHRVLPLDDPRAAVEEPGMVVTPETFARQLQWIRAFMKIVPLGDWLRDAARGAPLPARACAITFDDGWRDNHEFAYPVLRDTATPATVFVVSGMIGTAERFWPNRLCAVLQGAGSRAATDPPFDWLRQLSPVALNRAPDRESLAAIIAACKQLPDRELQARITELEAYVGMEATSQSQPQSLPCSRSQSQTESQSRPQAEAQEQARAQRQAQSGTQSELPSQTSDLMSWEQLSDMVDSGYVEVGSHTATHQRLTDDLPDAHLRKEVIDSAATIKARLGHPPRLFCYPNGDVCNSVMSMVAAHYDGAVTTARGINRTTDDPFLLKRITMHEGAGHSRHHFFARLSGFV